MRWSGPLIPLALLLAACGGEPAATTSLPGPATMTPVATTAAPNTTTVPATTSTTEQTIDVEISDGEVTGPDRFEVGRGETVEITIRSDAAYDIHVHGYDLRYELEPGEPLAIEFIADVPGIFEVETHPGHLILFEVEVGN